MRFLFVYQDYAQPAQRLINELFVDDVILIVARKNAPGPTPEEIKKLEAYPNAEAAACELNRKYRRVAEQYVCFCCTPNKFRFEDQALREWLVPKATSRVRPRRPSEAFQEAATGTPTLVLHSNALKSADDLAEHRWAFAARSAALLKRYALGEELSPLRNWKADHGVEFAANGNVVFCYAVVCANPPIRNRTQWHLKDGDRTSRESAARIYFARVAFPNGFRVLVFYVGPHPEEKEHTVEFCIE